MTPDAHIWCWRCMKHPVETVEDECRACKKIDADRFRRSGTRATVTHDVTHRRNRADLEALDRPKSGKRPDYRPGMQDEAERHGREPWDRYMVAPPDPPKTNDGVEIKTGLDLVLEDMADRWLAEAKRANRKGKT